MLDIAENLVYLREFTICDVLPRIAQVFLTNGLREKQISSIYTKVTPRSRSSFTFGKRLII